MSILRNLHPGFVLAASESAATEDAIERLREFASVGVPEDYEDIVREATEPEIQLRDHIYIRVWSPDGCIEMNDAYEVQAAIPNSLAVGDDEGGRAFIYMTGSQGFGLYIVGFGALAVEEADFVAPSLKDLLTEGIGVENL